MENRIDITRCDLDRFVRAVYRNSAPQGLGFLHFEEGELSDEQVREILGRPSRGCRLSMDYVNGRACKMTVWEGEGGKISIRDTWFDHTDGQLKKVLQEAGISK